MQMSQELSIGLPRLSTVRNDNFQFATIGSRHHDYIASPKAIRNQTVQTLILFLSLRKHRFCSLVVCQM